MALKIGDLFSRLQDDQVLLDFSGGSKNHRNRAFGFFAPEKALKISSGTLT
jgi:hypothetical protein